MSNEAKPETPDPDITATRRTLVTRALEFAAHGHGELPAGFMSDAVDCLAGVLRDVEEACLGPAEAPATATEAELPVRFIAARSIKPDSWLHDDRHQHTAAFRAFYGYVRNKTHAIEACAACSPEDLYYVVSFWEHWKERVRDGLEDVPLPPPPQKGDAP